MSTIKQRQQQQIINHRENLNKILLGCGSDVNAELCNKKLRRLELKASRASERWCNGEINEVQADKVFNEVKEVVLSMFNNNLKGFFINTDPRGYALKIDDKVCREHYPYLYQDMGGYGILSPEFTGR